MNFGFSEEQNLLRDQVARFMQQDCPMTKVRQLSKTESRFDADLWRQMAELGWLGLIIDEAYGGLNLTWVDMTVVLEETAAGLCPLPLVSHAMSCTAIMECGSEAQKSQWLPAMAAGDVTCTLALYDEPNWIDPAAINANASVDGDTVTLSGRKPFVSDAMSADYFLVAVNGPDGLALAALNKELVSVTPQPAMDETKPVGCVDLSGVTILTDYLLPMSLEQLNYLTDCGAVATTAEMVGAGNSVLQLTSDYAKERIQFGKPIGQYQGVKHRLAEIYVDVESYRSLCYYAAWTINDAREELPRAASLAKGYASDAFAQIGIDAVGLHGAIGFTA